MNTSYLLNLDTRERVELRDTLLIGRRPECNLTLDDTRVSRQHAMIRRQDDGYYWFYDLGSSNGSYINEQRVITTRRLLNGDVIRICETRFEFVGEMDGSTWPPGEPTMADIRTLPVLLLVSDIKGYSRFAHKLAPDALAQMIGSWYREYDQILHFYGATVDKFIGDAVLAYWLEVEPAARLQAVRAAHALQAACDRISAENVEVFDKLGLRLESGVGLHLGTVAHGQIEKGTFTLLGEAVNEAFQIEALTRGVGRDILLSRQFLEGWEAGMAYCADEGTHQIRDHTKRLHVYSLAMTPTR